MEYEAQEGAQEQEEEGAAKFVGVRDMQEKDLEGNHDFMDCGNNLVSEEEQEQKEEEEGEGEEEERELNRVPGAREVKEDAYGEQMEPSSSGINMGMGVNMTKDIGFWMKNKVNNMKYGMGELLLYSNRTQGREQSHDGIPSSLTSASLNATATDNPSKTLFRSDQGSHKHGQEEEEGEGSESRRESGNRHKSTYAEEYAEEYEAFDKDDDDDDDDDDDHSDRNLQGLHANEFECELESGEHSQELREGRFSERIRRNFESSNDEEDEESEEFEEGGYVSGTNHDDEHEENRENQENQENRKNQNTGGIVFWEKMLASALSLTTGRPQGQENGNGNGDSSNDDDDDDDEEQEEEDYFDDAEYAHAQSITAPNNNINDHPVMNSFSGLKGSLSRCEFFISESSLPVSFSLMSSTIARVFPWADFRTMKLFGYPGAKKAYLFSSAYSLDCYSFNNPATPDFEYDSDSWQSSLEYDRDNDADADNDNGKAKAEGKGNSKGNAETIPKKGNARRGWERKASKRRNSSSTQRSQRSQQSLSLHTNESLRGENGGSTTNDAHNYYGHSSENESIFLPPHGREMFCEHFDTIPWMTYRKGFAPTRPPYSFTSDTGWGCMLRSAQMILAQTLQRHFWGSSPHNIDKASMAYRSFLKWFADAPSLPNLYSIHRMIQAGEVYGKQAGEWYEPSIAAFVLRDLVDAHRCTDSETATSISSSKPSSISSSKSSKPSFSHAPQASSLTSIKPLSLVLKVAEQGIIYRDEIQRECRGSCSSPVESNSKQSPVQSKVGDDPLLNPSQSMNSWELSLFILVPLRLGLAGLHRAYVPVLLELLRLPQSAGLIGGRPGHSLYFVGSQGENLIYLDPHTVQSAVTCTDAVVPTLQEAGSYQCDMPRVMPISEIDPSLALGFYCRDENDFENLCQNLASLKRYGPETLHIADSRPPLYETLGTHFGESSDEESEGDSRDSDEEHEEDYREGENDESHHESFEPGSGQSRNNSSSVPSSEAVGTGHTLHSQSPSPASSTRVADKVSSSPKTKKKRTSSSSGHRTKNPKESVDEDGFLLL